MENKTKQVMLKSTEFENRDMLRQKSFLALPACKDPEAIKINDCIIDQFTRALKLLIETTIKASEERFWGISVWKLCNVILTSFCSFRCHHKSNNQNIIDNCTSCIGIHQQKTINYNLYGIHHIRTNRLFWVWKSRNTKVISSFWN